MSKFKLVICCINSKFIHSSLSAWCLYSGMKAFCPDVEVSVVEGTINEKSENVLNRILNENADAVSFSCYIWNIRETLKLAKRLKEILPDTKIIFGGPEVSFNPKEIMEENEFADYIISGEGEEALAKLSDALSKGEESQDGIASKRCGKKILVGKSHIFKGELSPYCEEYFASLGGRISYIEASRGCPYTCSFCLSGSDRSVRFFELQRVKEEMLLLASSGTKTIKFVDRTFNCNKKRAKEILLFIKENYKIKIPQDVCFHFEIAGDILDSELLLVISSMPQGSVQFEIGIQSFNSKTLEAINRKTDIQKLCENIQKLVSFKNCHIHIDLIAGLPFEGLGSFKESFNKAYALKANMLQLGFLKVLHGSCMENDAEKFGIKYSKEPPYEVISTPWISNDELSFLHIVEDALERLYNSSRFSRTLDYIMENAPCTPFDVFSSFALYVLKKGEDRPALDLYTSWVYEYFSACDYLDKTVLRDKMICDRIATNSSGVIPKCLQVEDERLKKAKNILGKTYPINYGEKRSVAILYSENIIVFCNYGEKDRVSGEYILKKVPFEQIFE